jgi:hypothetical protein
MFRKIIDRNGELSVGYPMHPLNDKRRARDRTFVNIYSGAEGENFHHPQSRHEFVMKRKSRRFFLRATQG